MSILSVPSASTLSEYYIHTRKAHRVLTFRDFPASSIFVSSRLLARSGYHIDLIFVVLSILRLLSNVEDR